MADQNSNAFADRFVELRGGLIVRADALALGVRLEIAGGEWRVDGDDLYITGVAISAADRKTIGELKLHLTALVTYRVPDDPCRDDDG